MQDTQDFNFLTQENFEESKNNGDFTDDAIIEATDIEAAIESIDVATQQLAAINNKKKRKGISFSKKRLLAKYSLYLKANKLADLKMAFPHTYESIAIYGQIKECPRNGRNHFRIVWGDSKGDTKGVDPSWLNSEVENNDVNKGLLQDAIEANEQEVTLSKVINKFQKRAPAATAVQRLSAILPQYISGHKLWLICAHLHRP
jgi:hypothetical protein